VSALQIIGVVVGMLLLVVGGFVAIVSLARNPSMSGEGELPATIILAGLALLGLWLVRRSSPRLSSGKLACSPAAFGRWLILPATPASPLGMAIWTLLITFIPLALVPRRNGARMWTTFAAFVIYQLCAIVALAVMTGWWRRALLTLLLGPVVLMGLVTIAEVFEKESIGQGGLAFLGPLMWSWAIIPVIGLIRLLVSRPSAPPNSSGPAS
jgi:hypothetical protein